MKLRYALAGLCALFAANAAQAQDLPTTFSLEDVAPREGVPMGGYAFMLKNLRHSVKVLGIVLTCDDLKNNRDSKLVDAISNFVHGAMMSDGQSSDAFVAKVPELLKQARMHARSCSGPAYTS